MPTVSITIIILYLLSIQLHPSAHASHPLDWHIYSIHRADWAEILCVWDNGLVDATAESSYILWALTSHSQSWQQRLGTDLIDFRTFPGFMHCNDRDPSDVANTKIEFEFLSSTATAQRCGQSAQGCILRRFQVGGFSHATGRTDYSWAIIVINVDFWNETTDNLAWGLISHEVGHFLGLADGTDGSCPSTSIMHGSYNCIDTWAWPQSNDVASARAIINEFTDIRRVLFLPSCEYDCPVGQDISYRLHYMNDGTSSIRHGRPGSVRSAA